MFALLLLILRGGGISPIVAQGSAKTVPAAIDRQFKRDAARLALRLDAEREDARYLAIAINRDNSQNLYKALKNIYLNSEVGQSIAKCNVHTFPNPSIDHIVIIYNKNMDWAAPLRQGISETNSNEINALLDRYNLAIEKHVQWNEQNDAITLRSREPLNMAALADQFDNIAGIIQIDLGLPKLAGNDIKAKRISGGWEIEFLLSLGANKFHSWKFSANDAGNVQLLKEGGEPLPSWMRCERGGETLAKKF